MRVQAGVLRDLGVAVATPPWRRAGTVVLTRAAAAPFIACGGLLVLPAVLGLYLSLLVSPALVASERRAGPALADLGRLIGRNINLLTRHATLLTLLLVIAGASAVSVQVVLINVALPSLMGVDTADLQVSMVNVAWWLSSLLLMLLVFDLYASVAAVFLLEQL